jgi:hypothetical protein
MRVRPFSLLCIKDLMPHWQSIAHRVTHMIGLIRILLVGCIICSGIGLSPFARANVFAQGAGHRVSNNQVTISGRSHWENWEFPQGTLMISPTGEVQAQRIKKNTNAVFGIVDYLRFNPPASLGGIDPEDIVLADAIEGGSNLEDVVNVFDGDMSTYWQPAEPRGDSELASQWWFVVDLGRMVLAKKLVVRFAEEGMGDPFLQFEVLVSDGLKPARLSGGDTPAFKAVLRTLKKNKSQRVFEIDLTNQQPRAHSALKLRRQNTTHSRQIYAVRYSIPSASQMVAKCPLNKNYSRP